MGVQSDDFSTVINSYQETVQLMQQVIGIIQQNGRGAAGPWEKNLKNMMTAEQVDKKAAGACMAMTIGSSYVRTFYPIEDIQRRLQAFMYAFQVIESQRIHTCNAQKIRDNVYELIQQLFSNGAIDGYVITALRRIYGIKRA